MKSLGEQRIDDEARARRAQGHANYQKVCARVLGALFFSMGQFAIAPICTMCGDVGHEHYCGSIMCVGCRSTYDACPGCGQ